MDNALTHTLFLLLPFLAVSQADYWEAMQGPPGASIRELVVSAKTCSIFATLGGADGVFRSNALKREYQ